MFLCFHFSANYESGTIGRNSSSNQNLLAAGKRQQKREEARKRLEERRRKREEDEQRHSIIQNGENLLRLRLLGLGILDLISDQCCVNRLLVLFIYLFISFTCIVCR